MFKGMAFQISGAGLLMYKRRVVAKGGYLVSGPGQVDKY